MKALIINGCNSFGKSLMLDLMNKGYDIILVDKNKKQLEFLKDNLDKEIEIISLDLSSNYNCKKLYNKCLNDDIEIVINCTNENYENNFLDEKLDRDLDLIDNNIIGVHILTKFFLKYFEEKNKGYLLNIIPDNSNKENPNMATYMASKAYILKLTQSINYELKVKNSNVYVGLGITNFINVDKNKDYKDLASLFIEGMLNKQDIIKMK